MNKFQEVEVIENDTLIRWIQTDSIEIEDLIKSLENLFKTNPWSKGQNHFLINCLNAKLNFTRNQINLFWIFLLNHKKKLQEIKIAVLASDPITTCFFLLIQDQIYQKIGCELKVFVTEKAALGWIKTSSPINNY
jgi:hypothetical protein